MTLKVSEIFGPTFQGEGPSIGKRAAFIRLAGCNLHCTWCDTPYSWDWQRYDPAAEITPMTPGEAAKTVRLMSCPLVVITGGEPLLQNEESLMSLTADLLKMGMQIEFETNGTLPGLPGDCRIAYNVSPKLAHAGDPLDDRLKMAALRKWACRLDSRFKFVVKDKSDGAEIEALMRELNLVRGRVWIMPEGQTPAELEASQWAALRVAEDLKCNYTDRLHIRLWGGQRGK